MNKLILLLIISCLWAQNLKAQTFKSLSGPEKKWVILHPFSALKAKKLSQKARHLADSIAKVSNWENQITGGKKDAIRHFIWMSLISNQIGSKRAKSLGEAHELGNKKTFLKGKHEDGDKADFAAMEMDLWNNEVGIAAGKLKQNLSESQIVKEALLKLENGELRMIKQNNNGQFIDKDDNIIPDSEWQGKWINRRCLMPSFN